MTRPALAQHHLNANAVAARASEFPRLAGLVRDRIEELPQRPVHIDSGPRLLVALGGAGRNTRELLRGLEATVELFDEESPSGWGGVRRQLATANKRSRFLSLAAEVVVARWLHERRFTILEFEPTTAAGKHPDLLISHGSEDLLVEVVSPGPESDSIDTVNTRLHVELERVATGLEVEVRGYDAVVGQSSAPGTSPSEARATVDAVVREFRHQAPRIDISRLPAPVVESGRDQPVSIKAVAYDQELADQTVVTASWSQSGFVPNVDRLVRVIRDERRHLEGETGAILVDLSGWSDFRENSYYLDMVRSALTKHTLPPFIGAFAWQSGYFSPCSRSSLHVDETWASKNLGHVLASAWDGDS